MERASTTRHVMALGLLGLLPTLAATARADVIRYTAVDLGTLPGASWSAPSGINNRGEVVGTVGYPDGSNASFLFSGGHISTSGSSGMIANAINDAGQVAYDDANAINSSGRIAGRYVQTSTSLMHAFVGSGGLKTDIGLLFPDAVSQAMGINDAGAVVGYYGNHGQERAFLYEDGRVTDPFQGRSGAAVAINGSGQIAGWSDAGRALLASDGNVLDLGTLGGSAARGLSLNDRGQVVGYSSTSDGATHAFLFAGGRMLDLDDLVSGLGGITLNAATGINSSGQIAAYGYDSAGNPRAFLLNPMAAPEPGMFLMLSGTFGAAILAKRAMLGRVAEQ